MVEVWSRIRKLDKEVVWVRSRIRAHSSTKMRSLYQAQSQRHRALSGAQRLGGLGFCAFTLTQHEHDRDTCAHAR